MSTDENKALARRFIQVWVPGNLGLVDELAAPDITVSYPMLSEPVHGAVALKQILAHSHVGIPDLREVNQRTGKRGWHAVSRSLWAYPGLVDIPDESG